MQLPATLNALLTSKGISCKEHVIKISFFDHSTHSKFNTFLIDERFKKIQVLQVIQEPGIDKEFLVGYEKISVFEPQYEEDIKDTLIKEFKPIILDKELNGEEIFQSILSRFAILQIISEDIIQRRLEAEFREYTNNHINYIHSEGEAVILTEPFILISRDAIYLTNQELARKIKSLISIHNEQFRELLGSSPVKVSHEIYVSWLLKWFPGLVRIRSLS